MLANSALAAASFLGESGLPFERISCPVVLMTWRTACFGPSMSNFGFVMLGKSANSCDNLDLSSAATNASPVTAGGCRVRWSSVVT